ncbi:MAG: S8 family serine peptidase [Pseudomonadota bacterium]|nr:S8 family serine peptidase [Pseudomonadota bacterium]
MRNYPTAYFKFAFPTTTGVIGAVFLTTVLAGCRAVPPEKPDTGDTGDCDTEFDLSGAATIETYSAAGKIRLNLRVDQFNLGPAAGAQQLSAELGQLRAIMSKLVGGVYQAPGPVLLATGPAPIVLWAPQSPRPLFAGEWTVPVGRLLSIEADVSSVVVTDASGDDHDVLFGPLASPTGVLRFKPPPGTTPMEVTNSGLKGWEMVLPAGSSGSLHLQLDGTYRLDSDLKGNAATFTRPFEFSRRRLVVRYASGTSSTAIAALEDQTEAETVWTSFTGLKAVEFDGTDWWSITERYLQYRASPIVEFVSLDPYMRNMTEHDPGYMDDYWYADEQGHLWDIRVAPSDDSSTDYAWDDSEGSRDVVLGFIDGGLDYNHPDLVNNLYVNVDEFPDGLVATCGLDPMSTGMTIEMALDFDEDGVFTLHDLNAGLVDETVRDDTLDLLDLCGYPVSATASTAAYDYDPLNPIVQADDFLETFADADDTDGNGFVDDFFGANFRSLDSRCADGTFAAATCDPWDINPDDRCNTGLPHCDETFGIQHGTQMAGIAAAEGNNARSIAGVIGQVRILEARSDNADVSTILSFSQTMEAADYLIAEGAHVIVCPWGSVMDIPPECAVDFAAEVGAEYEARTEALFVFAAGNEATNCDDPDLLCFPGEAEADNLVAVGATLNLLEKDTVTGDPSGMMTGYATFSNFGDDTIDIAAPGGEDLPSIANGFADYTWVQYSAAVRSYTSGTSAASAIVGGAAALRLAACTDPVDGSVLRTALLGSAQDRSTELTGSGPSLCGGGLCIGGGRYLDAAEFIAVSCP